MAAFQSPICSDRLSTTSNLDREQYTRGDVAEDRLPGDKLLRDRAFSRQKTGDLYIFIKLAISL